MIWRRLLSVLAPEGVLVVGKAERPPSDAGLTRTARCIYRSVSHETFCRERPPCRSNHGTTPRGTPRRAFSTGNDLSETLHDRVADGPQLGPPAASRHRFGGGRIAKKQLGVLPMSIGAKIGTWFTVGLMRRCDSAVLSCRHLRKKVGPHRPLNTLPRWSSLPWPCMLTDAVGGCLRPSAAFIIALSGSPLGSEHRGRRAGDRGHRALGAGGRLLVHPAVWAVHVSTLRMTSWPWGSSPAPAFF